MAASPLANLAFGRANNFVALGRDLGLRPRNDAEIRTVEILFADCDRVPLTPSPSPARGEGRGFALYVFSCNQCRCGCSFPLARRCGYSFPLSPCGRGAGGEGGLTIVRTGKHFEMTRVALMRARFSSEWSSTKGLVQHPEFPSRRSPAVISSARLPDWQGIARFQDDKRRNETARRPL